MRRLTDDDVIDDELAVNGGLLGIVAQRAERSGLGEDEQLIVLAAFEGEGPLEVALSGDGAENPRRHREH